jgi:GTPase SAR1 family protein
MKKKLTVKFKDSRGKSKGNCRIVPVAKLTRADLLAIPGNGTITICLDDRPEFDLEEETPVIVAMAADNLLAYLPRLLFGEDVLLAYDRYNRSAIQTAVAQEHLDQVPLACLTEEVLLFEAPEKKKPETRMAG